MPHSAVGRTSHMSICPRRSAAAISISPKAKSIDCGVPAIMAASPRWKMRATLTARASLIKLIVSADRATPKQVLMFDFDALSNAIVRRTVLRVGDLMLDEFVYGEVSRISPEAPAPVIVVQRSETNIGGAGNVARNIAALGARCIFVGLIGDDEAGAKLKAQLSQHSS